MDYSEPIRLHTLPVDILIDIFKALPSFGLVYPLVQAHRAFNDVWKANFNEIAPFIAQKNFQPWADALNLMLEQKNGDEDVIALPGPYLRLSKDDIAQMKSNARYVFFLQKAHETWKLEWWKLPISEIDIFRFRRATYRVWKFMLTMYMTKCEEMCEGYSIMELIEMQLAAREFNVFVEFEVKGFPESSEREPTGTAISSLQGMVRRRAAAFCECDESIESDDIFDSISEYSTLRMLDPKEVRDKEWCKRVVGRLEEYEKKLKEKQLKDKQPKTAVETAPA